MIREAIAMLVEGRKPSREEALQTMREIVSGEATPAQIAAYITALRIQGETADIIAGSAQAMREKYTPVKAPEGVVVDVVGTGGDGAHTFNISTAAAFVVAGAGIPVAKHGNRNVSSRSGSADVLEALGIRIGLTAEGMSQCLHECGIAFLFAPSLHPAMKHAIGPRKEIGIRTIFNILGPLSNPANTKHGLLGVYSRALVPLIAHAAADLGAQHMMIVHGSDGLDELTTTGLSVIAEVRAGHIREWELRPQDLGLALATPDMLQGGSPDENAVIVRAVLGGEKGPRRDVVLLNAAAALITSGETDNWKDALKLAADSVDAGKALDKLEQLATLSQKLAGV